MRDFFVPKFSGYEKITIQHFFGKSVGFKKKSKFFKISWVATTYVNLQVKIKIPTNVLLQTELYWQVLKVELYKAFNMLEKIVIHLRVGKLLPWLALT